MRVTATEAKNRFGALLDAVADDEAVVITSHGQTAAVLIPPAAFDELADLRQERKRREAWQKFQELSAEITSRAPALDEDLAEIEGEIDEAIDEAMERLIARGEVRFQAEPDAKRSA